MPGNPAYRMNILSAFWFAVSAGLLAAFIQKIGGARKAVASVAGLLAALAIILPSPLQRVALSAEVFGLHLVILVGMLVAIYWALESNSILSLRVAAFLFGLGLTNQQITILAAPTLLWTVFVLFRRRQLSNRELLKLVVAALIPFTLYAYLPIRAATHPVLNWEEPSTWSQFWFVVLRKRYGSLQLAQGNQPWSVDLTVASLKLFFLLLWDHVGWPWLGVAFLGLWSIRKKPEFAIGLLTFAILSGPAFFVLSKVTVTLDTRMIMERFLPATFLIISLLIAFATLSYPWLAAGLFLAGLAGHRPSTWPQPRNDFYCHDLARSYLDSLPRGSLVIADESNEVETSLAYMLDAEHRRPDIRFVDANAGVTPSIYGKAYYSIWGDERLAIRNAVEGKLIAGWPGAAYYATLIPQHASLSLVRDGLVMRAKGPVRSLDWSKVLAMRKPGAEREQILNDGQQDLLARYLVQSGQLAEAEAVSWIAADASDDPAQWLSEAAAWLFESGAYKQSASFGEASERLRADPVALANLGAALHQLGRFTEAARVERKALSLDPYNERAQLNLTVTCYVMRDWQCASEAARNYLVNHPDNGQIRSLLDQSLRRAQAGAHRP